MYNKTNLFFQEQYKTKHIDTHLWTSNRLKRNGTNKCKQYLGTI